MKRIATKSKSYYYGSKFRWKRGPKGNHYFTPRYTRYTFKH